LRTIATNTVADHLRARRVLLPLECADDRQDPGADVEGAVIVRLEVGRAWHMIDELCDAQRTAVTLRLGADLPIADIASRMERTEGAVKLLLNRGITTVRARMTAETDGWRVAS
jgi:DNA-directed RNA polymerase specialized sigma24 family protein